MDWVLEKDFDTCVISYRGAGFENTHGQQKKLDPLYQLKVTFLPLEIFYTALFDKMRFSNLALVVGGKLQPCY